MNAKTKLRLIVGVYLIIMLSVIFPTPLHNWLADIELFGVPLDLGIVALVILFTPVTILASIMRKFDVDFVDEGPDDGTLSSYIPNMINHAH